MTYVEETEHGSPTTGTSLTEMRKLVEVVFSENRVDGKLNAEGTEVTESTDEDLRSDKDTCHLLERWLLDNLSLGGVDHGLL